MGYIKTQQDLDQAVHQMREHAAVLEVSRPGGVGLKQEGIDKLAERARDLYDLYGSISYKAFVALVNELVEDPRYGGALLCDMPHQNDPQLRWLNSIDDLNEASADKIRRYARPGTEIDASGKSLAERFAERVTWLRNNKIRRPKVEKPEPTPLTPEQKAKKELLERFEHVRSTVNSIGPAWSDRAKRKKEHLTKVLSDMCEKHKTIDEIERVIAKEIREINDVIR